MQVTADQTQMPLNIPNRFACATTVPEDCYIVTKTLQAISRDQAQQGRLSRAILAGDQGMLQRRYV